MSACWSWAAFARERPCAHRQGADALNVVVVHREQRGAATPQQRFRQVELARSKPDLSVQCSDILGSLGRASGRRRKARSGAAPYHAVSRHAAAKPARQARTAWTGNRLLQVRRWRCEVLYAIVIHVFGRVLLPTASAAVLSVRLSASERALLEAAAEQASTNLSDFVRRRALEAAETDLLNRRIVTIPAKDWARFEAWASAPARDVPALRKLSKTRPVWQK